ncbi:MAG: flavin reductase family protein [Egibacteraceae bacterium]
MATNGTATRVVDRDAFRQAMTRFAAGVTIVTTIDGSRRAWGFTASAFTSLSLDPPLVLVCLNSGAHCHPSFAVADGFAVNVLRPEHEELALRFASKGADKFGSGEFQPSISGFPVLPDALAVIECSTEQRIPGGDHTILIGRVRDCHAGDGAPMVYFNRDFRTLMDS